MTPDAMAEHARTREEDRLPPEPDPEIMLDSFAGPLGREVRKLVLRHGKGGEAIVPVLTAVQRARGSLSDTALRVAAHALGVRSADLKELAVAGGFFVERVPAHSIVVCVHKHCRARGAWRLLEMLREETGLAPGTRSPSENLAVETVRCVGSCEVGPNVLVDGAWYSGVDPDGLRRILQGLSAGRPARRA
jgi:NADH:ubiquinone oxidoreductase subunit E